MLKGFLCLRHLNWTTERIGLLWKKTEIVMQSTKLSGEKIVLQSNPGIGAAVLRQILNHLSLQSRLGKSTDQAAGGYTWRPNMENEGFKMSQFPNPFKFSSSLSDCFMGYLGDEHHHAGLLILSFVLSCCHLNDCFIILSQRTKGNLC